MLFFAYNQEAFVEEALLSALRQDVGSYELVVVDDASTDRTRSVIVTVLARATPAGLSVRTIFKETNAGLVAAVNDAMAVASGDVFVLMAGDDVAMPDRIGRTLRIFAADSGVQLVAGECLKIDEAGRPHGPAAPARAPQAYSYDDGRALRIYAGASPFGASAACRRRLFDFFGPMGAGDHGEDNCYWVRALLLGRVYHDSACFVHWRQHSGNLSNFTSSLDEAAWRRRHLAWMEKHETMSRQWLKDIALAREAGLISWVRARRLRLAALREDRTWGLEVSTLRLDPWREWTARACKLLLVGRLSTTLRMFMLRISRGRQERRWRFWAKLRSNSAS